LKMMDLHESEMATVQHEMCISTSPFPNTNAKLFQYRLVKCVHPSLLKHTVPNHIPHEGDEFLIPQLLPVVTVHPQ